MPDRTIVPTLTPSRVLRIYGMRRSGNHAIINWLQRNAPGGNSVFLNNCRPGRDPLQSHRSLEVYVEGAALKNPQLPDAARAGTSPLCFVSFEDAMPHPNPAKMAPLFPTATGGETVVIIYRAFLNWSASLLQKITGNKGYGPLERARVMSSAMLEYGRGLARLSEKAARGFVAICYDRWNTSETYRSDILAELDLPARDNTRGAVQRYGGGSSFQGKAATVDDLQTDRRAAQMADNPEYQMLLWTAARDLSFMERLAAHFPDDAERVMRLLEGASLTAHLPDPEVAIP